MAIRQYVDSTDPECTRRVGQGRGTALLKPLAARALTGFSD